MSKEIKFGEDARKKIAKIEKLLSNVYGYIETIAQYCNMVEVVIPNQLIDLECRSKDFIKECVCIMQHQGGVQYVGNAGENHQYSSSKR